MARGFNTTVGSGTTDKISSVLTAHGTTRSWSIWANRRADANSELWNKNSVETITASITNGYVFKRALSGGTYEWRYTAPATGSWKSIIVTYDSSTPTTAPVMYYAGVVQSTASTAAAAGTANTNASVYDIGNIAASNRCFDGSLAEFAVWDRILTQAEATAIGTANKSARFIPGLVEYIPLAGGATTSVILSAPTVVGTLSTTHPIIAFSHTRSASDRGIEYGVGYQMPS